METDQNLEDVHNNFRFCETKTNSILDLELFCQHLTSVKFDKIIKFSVDN